MVHFPKSGISTLQMYTKEYFHQNPGEVPNWVFTEHQR